MIAHACASRLQQAESRRRLEPEPFGAFRAAEAGVLSETITLACCVTLPTIALPPPDRHVLHGDGRLAMAPVAVESLDLGGKGAGEPAQ